MNRKGGYSLLFIVLVGSLILGVNLIFSRNFLPTKDRSLLSAQLSLTSDSSATSSVTTSTTATSSSDTTSNSETITANATVTISDIAAQAQELSQSNTNTTTATVTSGSSGKEDNSMSEKEDLPDEEDFTPHIDEDLNNLKGVVKIKTKKKIKADSISLKIEIISSGKEKMRIFMPPDFLETNDYPFNTQLVEDDYYRLSFIIVKRNKIKESKKIAVRILNNTNISSTTTSLLSEMAASGPTAIIYDLKLNKKLKNLKGRIKATLKVNTSLLKAELLLKKPEKNEFISLGQMRQKDENNWEFDFDTRLQPNGDYELLVKVTTDYGDFFSPTIKISINNNIKPPVLVIIEGNKLDLKERIKIKTKVEDADEINLFIQRKGSLTEILINKFAKVSDDEWEYELNTKDQPNGEYILFVKVRNIFGEYKSGEILIKINNPTIQVTNIEQVVENLSKQIQENTISIVTSTEQREQAKEQLLKKLVQEVETIKKQKEREASSKEFSNKQEETSSFQVIVPIPSDVRNRLEQRFNHLVSLPDTATSVKTPLDSFEGDVSLIKKKEKISIEELNNQVEKRIVDLDNDGLSNDDEMNIYNTDPLNADSDNDGFIDGIEVLSGFAPDAPSPADKIIYEEPKDKGIERPEIYKINDIKLEVKTDEAGQKVAEKVVFKGTAPSNSFVTLYIYSLPTILVVKANEFGYWEYHLEKDLGEGEHTVYVTLTDNKGRVVEKSAPFKFVKQAQAITVLDVEKSLQNSQKVRPVSAVSFWDNREDSLLNDYVFLGFVITVVAFLVAVTSLIYVVHKYSSKRL